MVSLKYAVFRICKCSVFGFPTVFVKVAQQVVDMVDVAKVFIFGLAKSVNGEGGEVGSDCEIVVGVEG